MSWRSRQRRHNVSSAAYSGLFPLVQRVGSRAPVEDRPRCMVEPPYSQVAWPGLRVARTHPIFPIGTVAMQPATGRGSGGEFRTGIRLVAHLDWGDEAVAAPDDIYNEPVATAPIAQRAPQRGNMDRKVGRLDKYVGPNPT